MDAQLALHLDATRPVLSLAHLSEEERAVAQALRRGRANARKVREIAAEAGIPNRRAQEIVQQLLHEHGWPIGTAMEAPHGNYLIDSATELAATVDLLTRRGISNLARAAALKRMSLRRYINSVQTDLADMAKELP